jgi:predicted PurR-regulated permease PerM
MDNQTINTNSNEIRHAPTGAERAEQIGKKTAQIAGKTVATAGKFLLGQLISSLVLGVITAILMIILNIPFAWLLPFIMAIFSFIPAVGGMIGTVLCTVFLLIFSNGDAMKFMIMETILQLVYGVLIYPKIIGNYLGIPGVMVFTVSTVAGWFFGIPGMLISIPIASVIYGLYRENKKKKQMQQQYQQVQGQQYYQQPGQAPQQYQQPQQPVQNNSYRVLPKNAPNHFE